MPLRGLRGATTLDRDEVEHLTDRMVELFQALFEANDIGHDDLVSIIFTATDDIRCTFPATAARKFGLGDVPLICARELDVEGGTARCVRILIHLETDRERSALHHVYQHGAQGLRDDLPS
jgi:chorismate mutase